MWYREEKILSVALVDGKLVVERSVPSNCVQLTYPPQTAPDNRFKDIYSVKDGKIVLETILRARYTPSVPEKYEYGQDDDKPSGVDKSNLADIGVDGWATTNTIIDGVKAYYATASADSINLDKHL